jgi:hypothetical protein
VPGEWNSRQQKHEVRLRGLAPHPGGDDEALIGDDASHLPHPRSLFVHPSNLVVRCAVAYPFGVIILPHFTPSIVVRSLVSWAFVRVLAGAAGSVLAAPGANPLRLVPWAALVVVAAAGAMGWVSARRRYEDIFLLSLGFGRARMLATMMAPAALAEVALSLAIGT